MTTPTKTVELPLTKTEQRHLANIERRDAKRARAQEKRESIMERDAKLKAINDDFGPRIAKLHEQRAAALRKVWDEWRKARAAA